MSQRQDPRAMRLTADASRKKRETEALQLRNKHREEVLIKRRNFEADIAATPISDIQGAIVTFFQQIQSESEDLQRQGTEGFQQLLLDKNPPIDEIIASGAVPRLIQFLGHQNEDIQYKSLWALTNIAAGKHEHAEYLVYQGAAEHFVRMMGSQHPRLREQACWALGNIAGDCATLRNEVLQAGAMDAVIAMLREEDPKLSAVKTATWTMSNLCRGRPPPPFESVKAAIPIAARYIYSYDKEVEVDALWTLVFLSDGADTKQEAVAAEMVCQRLVMLLKTNELAYLVPAVRTIGNLMSGDDVTTQKVIDNGALNALLPLLSHPRSGVRKEACWSVSNVLAGDIQQIQAAMDGGLIQPILHLLRNPDERSDIKREAAWCIANAVSGAHSRQIIQFVELDVLPALCDLLKEDDERLIDMTLDAIERVLQVGKKMAGEDNENPFATKIEQFGGSGTLEELQDHESNKLYERAKSILETYFPLYSNGAEADQPATGNAYNWNANANASAAPQSRRYEGF